MARVRVRQHVNPLSSRYQHQLTPPDWSQVYSNLSLPFHLDLGCGRGRFLAKMAQIQPDVNFLGLEIREPLVVEANQLRDALNLTNLHYLFTNINNSLEAVLASLPPDSLELVTVQFPDPWFKKKHHKRRLVRSQLVETLARHLKSGGRIFLQSDVRAIAEEMCDRFLASPQFQPLEGQIWLADNPLPIMTEREIATIKKDKLVYRTILVKR